VEKALSSPPAAIMALYADVHAYADVGDDAFLYEGTLVDPLQLQHFYPETLRTYYRVLSLGDLPDLQHASPLLLVSAFIICPNLYYNS